MHQNKLISKLRFKNKIRYFSYSIPLACIMALICGLFIMRSSAYAASSILGNCDTGVQVKNYKYVSVGDYYSYPCIFEPVLTPTETFEISTGTTTPTASLSIDGQTSISDTIDATYGETNYASHTISVDITGASDYALILSGPAQLTGPSAINATAGATGANLANDTWGYAWENTGVTNATANYKALNSNIALIGDTLSDGAASFSRKLAFAVKFSDKAATGTYHADISLSLTATPEAATTITATNAVPWNKMVFMQDMTEYACMQAKIGDSKVLTDVRDDNAYTITKLSDGKCWMAQNLRLSRDTLKNFKGADNNTYSIALSAKDSNLANYHVLPTSTTDAFSNSKDSNGFYTNQQIWASSSRDYGAYYSYNAATANTVASKSSGTAEYDICPKGWRLPTGGESGEFQALYNVNPSVAGWTNALWTSSNWSTSTEWASGAEVNGRWLGAANHAAGGTFFPAAGLVEVSGFAALPFGFYWSSTIKDITKAHLLYIDSQLISPAGSSNGTRWHGHAVRCIAK